MRWRRCTRSSRRLPVEVAVLGGNEFSVDGLINCSFSGSSRTCQVTELVEAVSISRVLHVSYVEGVIQRFLLL